MKLSFSGKTYESFLIAQLTPHSIPLWWGISVSKIQSYDAVVLHHWVVVFFRHWVVVLSHWQLSGWWTGGTIFITSLGG